MKHIVAMAAGLGCDLLDGNSALESAGLSFKPTRSAFPAVTCTAQATFRTAAEPSVHGMTSNGFFSRELRRPFFWEQSSALVHGPRVWDAARASGAKVGMYFWQQSLGESVDYVISPAPIHKHGGGMIMRNYTKPSDMGDALDRACGTFPLHRYWGPLASPKVGRAVLENFFKMSEAHSPDYALLYLPTLDYAAQRSGPSSRASRDALKEFLSQLATLAEFASARNVDLTVCGDYSIAPVDRPPAFPNMTLRRAGLFNVRPVGPRTYPDFNTSAAFAMCDHEIAHVFVRDGDPDIAARAMRALEETGEYESVAMRADQPWAHPSGGELLLIAKKGSWCAYPWWTDPREAPDYATHIDIHNKPGYDPCELFFGRLFPPGTCQDWSRVKGSHGRTSTIAWASTDGNVRGETMKDIASTIFAQASLHLA